MNHQTEKTILEKLKSLWSKKLEKNLDKTLRDALFSFMEKVESDNFDEIRLDFNTLFIAYTKAVLEEDVKSLNYISKNFEAANLMIETKNEKDVLKGKFQGLHELAELLKPNYFPTELENKLISNDRNVEIIQYLKEERMSYAAKIAKVLSISSQHCGDLLHNLEKNGFLYSKQVGKKRIYSLTGVGVSAARYFSKDTKNARFISVNKLNKLFQTIVSGLYKFVSTRNPERLDELEQTIHADESISQTIVQNTSEIINIIKKIDTPLIVIEVGAPPSHAHTEDNVDFTSDSTLAYTTTLISKAGTIEEFSRILDILDSLNITDWLSNMGLGQQKKPLFGWYDDYFEEAVDKIAPAEKKEEIIDPIANRIFADIRPDNWKYHYPRKKKRIKAGYSSKRRQLQEIHALG